MCARWRQLVAKWSSSPNPHPTDSSIHKWNALSAMWNNKQSFVDREKSREIHKVQFMVPDMQYRETNDRRKRHFDSNRSRFLSYAYFLYHGNQPFKARLKDRIGSVLFFALARQLSWLQRAAPIRKSNACSHKIFYFIVKLFSVSFYDW